MGDKEKMGTKKKGGEWEQKENTSVSGKQSQRGRQLPLLMAGRAAAAQEPGMAGSPESATGNGQGSVSLAASLLNLQKSCEILWDPHFHDR